jgi:hypothetical protein
MTSNDRPRWSWLAGGLVLAGVLLFAVATQKPLGVSTQYVVAVGGIAEAAAPGCTAGNAYLTKTGIKLGYAEWLVLGIPLGALLVALFTRRWGHAAVPAAWTARFGAGKGRRFLAAFLGGAVMLFGARLAGGCTSGHILSGVSQLAVSSILFFAAAFGSAVLVARGAYGQAATS